MVGLALVKSVYTLPTWSRTVRLVAEHPALRDALGDAPSVHAAVCTKTDLPIAWHTASACDSEHEHMPSLLDTVIRRGFTPGTCAMDKGYDGSNMYAACESRDIRPVIPLKLTVNVANGLHKPPSCQHGVWTFAGSVACPGSGCTWT